MCERAEVDCFQVFRELGQRIDEAWRAVDYRELEFPEVAAAKLQEAQLHERVKLDDLFAAALATDPLPPQFDLDASFGQPPLTLFRSDRFLVDALFWLDSTTSIHEHKFSGAFCVLHGSSLHSRFSFQLQEQVSAQLGLGDLRHDRLEALVPGDVRPIVAGPDLIHSVFHLETPTVSIVVRTPEQLGWARPQVTYFRSGLAYTPFHKPNTRTRHIQLLRCIARLGEDRLESFLGPFLSSKDPTTQALALLEVSRLRALDVCHDVLEGLGMNGALERAVSATMDAQKRANDLTACRRFIKDPDQRLMIALLLNVHDRQGVLDLVRTLRPEADPIPFVVDRVRDVSKAIWLKRRKRYKRRRGHGFELRPRETDLWVLSQLLQGKTRDELAAHLATKPSDLELDADGVQDCLENLDDLTALDPLLE